MGASHHEPEGALVDPVRSSAVRLRPLLHDGVWIRRPAVIDDAIAVVSDSHQAPPPSLIELVSAVSPVAVIF